MCVHVYVLLNPFWRCSSWGFLLSSKVLQSKPSMLRGKYVQCSKAQEALCRVFSSPLLCQTLLYQNKYFKMFFEENQSKISNSYCRTLGLVFQSENFSYNHYTNHIMDSWPYLDTTNPEPNHSKLRLNPGETMTALTMLQDQCRVDHLQFSHPNKQISFFIFLFVLNF